MVAFVRPAGAALVLVLSAGLVPAASQKEIDAAVQRGADYLRGAYKNGLPQGTGDALESGYPVGRHALVGLALIEAGTPITDNSLKSIVDHVRDRSYSLCKTYDIAVALFFLDRLGEPADVPLIQMLAARLLAGQTSKGGWGYDCCTAVPQADEQRLRTGLRSPPLTTGKEKENDKGAPKMHPEAEQYLQALLAAGQGRSGQFGEDNSNTQFGVLGVWLARKHGVPTEAALNLIELRFLNTQLPTGGWAYHGMFGQNASPSMTCAGLLGLATGVARREERRLKTAAPPPAKGGAEAKGNDPFFNPPPPKAGEKKGEKKGLTLTDLAVKRAFDHLALVLADGARRGKTGILTRQGNAGGHGVNDLYFLWSLERVGVIYGSEKIGGMDWYDIGADAIVATQSQNGSWTKGFSSEVDTSFALLFLLKANLARDLSSRVQKETNAELRIAPGPGSGNPVAAGGGGQPGTEAKAGAGGATEVPPVISTPLPVPVDDETAKLATELVRAAPTEWAKALEKFRDTKGGEYTKALTAAVHRLDGDRKKQAREALAERLTRMTAATLRTMLKSEDAELRRGAALACAMKDDKAHVPDLIDRLTDADDLVVRAAKAGLKSLTAQDFGPESGASDDKKKLAAETWKAWWAKQKK